MPRKINFEDLGMENNIEENKVNIIFKVPISIKKKLVNISLKKGVSLTSIVNDLIMDGLKRKGEI